jgi:hypothetical protein
MLIIKMIQTIDSEEFQGCYYEVLDMIG